MKRFLIAGNQAEAFDWLRKKHIDPGNSDFRIITNIDQLRGIRNPTGKFIGSWRSRSDIIDIVRLLLVSTDAENPSVEKLGFLLYCLEQNENINGFMDKVNINEFMNGMIA